MPETEKLDAFLHSFLSASGLTDGQVAVHVETCLRDTHGFQLYYTEFSFLLLCFLQLQLFVLLQSPPFRNWQALMLLDAFR